MRIGNKKYKFQGTYKTHLEAQREASRWLKNFSAKVVRTPKGRYSVYSAPRQWGSLAMKSKYSYPLKVLHYKNGKPIKRNPKESGAQYWERCRKLGAKEYS